MAFTNGQWPSEHPLHPNAEELVAGAFVGAGEPAQREASNNQLPVFVPFLLAPGISPGLRIQAGAALDVLHEDRYCRIEDVGNLIAGILLHELFLIGVGLIEEVKDGPDPTVWNHIAA